MCQLGGGGGGGVITTQIVLFHNLKSPDFEHFLRSNHPN